MVGNKLEMPWTVITLVVKIGDDTLETVYNIGFTEPKQKNYRESFTFIPPSNSCPSVPFDLLHLRDPDLVHLPTASLPLVPSLDLLSLLRLVRIQIA